MAASSGPTIIPARSGAHMYLQKGESIRVITPSGKQVIDLWAFGIGDPSCPITFMSMAQSRQKLGRCRPQVGDTLVDQRRAGLLTVVKDTSPGVHDMLYPACDGARYAELGQPEHKSCAGNLQDELAKEGLLKLSADTRGDSTTFSMQNLYEDELKGFAAQMVEWGWTPEPLNLFMNVSVSTTTVGQASLEVHAPACKPGNSVTLRAETNGGTPNEAAFEVVPRRKS